MPVVRIRIHNRHYEVACGDGQEGHLQALAAEVDSRIGALTRGAGAAPGETMALLLAALTLADEVIESKKENERIAGEMQELAGDERRREEEERALDAERAMAVTLEEIAERIEHIARRVEVG